MSLEKETALAQNTAQARLQIPLEGLAGDDLYCDSLYSAPHRLQFLSSTAHKAMIGRTISHYRILRQLGEGGMGVVYVAEDMHLARLVAIKIPTAASNEDHYRSRFLREARAISALSHPHIAAIHDYGETDEGQPFIVMELVDGQNLSELLHASALTIPRAVEIVADVADALAAAHKQGIIHRDIKPSNVIVNENGKVKVLDFGLAKQLNENGAGGATSPDAQTLISMKTRSDVVIGTPLYLSPEQARGAPVDARSDIFALGALLYECIAGRPAFSGANIIEIGGQVLHVDPPPPSTFNPRVPAELDRITLKALAKKAEGRYQSARAFCEELMDVHAGLSGIDTTRIRRLVTAQESAGRSSMLLTISDTLRRPRLSPAAFLGAIFVILFGIWGYMRWSAPTLHEPDAAAVGWYVKGANFIRDGAYDQASKALMRAGQIDDKYALVHAALAEVWMEMDYPDRAKSELLVASVLAPDRSVLPRLDALYLDAIRFTAMRQFGQAIQPYSEIARLKPDEPQVYVDLGRAYEKNEKLKDAIKSYLKAISLDSQYAAAYLRLGILYGRQSEQPSAIDAFSKAYSLYQSSGNAEGSAEVFFQRGVVYKDASNFPEAQKDLQRALDMVRASENQYQRIQTQLALSNVLLNNKQLDEAEQNAQEGVNLAQAGGMYSLHARGLVDLGNVKMARGDYGGAEKYFREALEAAQRNNVKRAEARAQFALGSLLIQQGKREEGFDFVKKALDYYKLGGFRKETVQGSTLLGRMYRQKGDYDTALQTFEQQLRDAKDSNFPLYEAMANTDIGRVLVQQERYPDALKHFEESYAINKRTGGSLWSVGYSLLNRGTALARLGRYPEAAALTEQALTIAEPGGYKVVLADLYLLKAEIALSRRQFAQALSLADKSLELAGTDSVETSTDARRVRGLALAYSGAGVEGARACEEAVAAATDNDDTCLRAQSLLALSEALLENGDNAGALARALEAQEIFSRGEQPASEWLALLVAARASQRTRQDAPSRDYATRASSLLDGLEERWGSENYRSYLARPDVQHSHRQLEELLAVDK